MFFTFILTLICFSLFNPLTTFRVQAAASTTNVNMKDTIAAGTSSSITKGASLSLLALYKIPGIKGLSGKDGNGAVNIKQFLAWVFKIMIGFSLAAAVVRIFYGGFLFATTESISNKGEAMKIIKNSFYGLALVLGAYLILYTIDPHLVSLNFLNTN